MSEKENIINEINSNKKISENNLKYAKDNYDTDTIEKIEEYNKQKKYIEENAYVLDQPAAPHDTAGNIHKASVAAEIKNLPNLKKDLLNKMNDPDPLTINKKEEEQKIVDEKIKNDVLSSRSVIAAEKSANWTKYSLLWNIIIFIIGYLVGKL